MRPLSGVPGAAGAVRASRTAGVAVLAVLAVAACTTTAADEVRGFEFVYETGSIAPPYNHAYRVEGERDGEELVLSYTLTYLYREGMDEDELESLGYSAEEDIEWSTTLTGDTADAWFELAAATEVRARSDELVAGSDYVDVTIVLADGSERSGVPVNRESWEAMADDLDRQAREALDHPQPGR